MNASDASLMTPECEVRRFAPFHRWDRNFFLLCVALIWFGLAMGFDPQIASQIASQIGKHQSLPFRPFIVPVHGAVFIAWMVLLSVQVLLIRSRRVELHRQLGMLGAMLAGAMIVFGAATALSVQRFSPGEPGVSPPAFLSVQFADMIAFAGLAGAAFLLTRQPAAHKRLIFLAALYISDAGFSRWFGPPLKAPIGESSVWALMVVIYLGSDHPRPRTRRL
ncbi:MAG: hypothetical protein WBE92_05745 [Steroidobacteraceae bacterium]